MKSYHLLVSTFTLLATCPVLALTPETDPLSVEVFTTTEVADDWQYSAENNNTEQAIDLWVYALDGIQRFEAELSQKLPDVPERAKSIALQHIEQLDEATRASVRQSEMGLAKAMQYGIDRYPAVVFDERAVVYGVTDLEQALSWYRQWREASEK